MRFLIIVGVFLLTLSCEDMETVIEIEMPPIEKELVIEYVMVDRDGNKHSLFYYLYPTINSFL